MRRPRWQRGHRPRNGRDGLTLYEVFLSLVILAGALAVLSQHMATGTRAGVSGQLQTEAALLCETKMAEVVSGVVPMSPVADAQLVTPRGTGWTWTLKVLSGANAELLELVVTVMHTNSQGTVNASVTLRRFIRNPQIYLNASASASAGAPTSAASTSSVSQPAAGGQP